MTEGYIKESPWRKTKQEINEPPSFIYSGVDGLSVYVVSSTYVWPLHPYWQSSTASVTQLRHQEMDSSSSGYDFLTAVWPGDKGTGPVYTWCSVLLICYCVLMTMTYQTCLRSPRSYFGWPCTTGTSTPSLSQELLRQLLTGFFL